MNCKKILKQVLSLALRGTILCLILIHSLEGVAGPVGRVSLSQVSLISPDYDRTQKRDFGFVSAGLDTLNRYKSEVEIENALQIQARGMLVPGVNVLNYLDVSQLFWKQDIFSIGRKKLKWSSLDEDFGLGIYQPVFKWNPLKYDSQGFTGIFINLEPETTPIPWGIQFFGSNIFIPNQGPGYEIKEGQFERSNPYFPTPPSRAEINGQETQFSYVVNQPNIGEIINHSSFAARSYMGQESEGPHIAVGYANKPANELNLGFQGILIPQQKIEVQLEPKVMYHSVKSSELKYSWRNISIGFEFLRETPQETSFNPAWTYAVYDETDFYSAFINWHYGQWLLSARTLTVRGGESHFEGPRAGEAQSVLLSRYPFRDAYLLKLQYNQVLSKYRSVAVHSQYLMGTQGEFDVWTSTIGFQFQEKWSAFMTSQLVAVRPVDQSIRKSIYHSFADNDLVAVGVSYVF